MSDRGLRWLRVRSGAAALIDPFCGGAVHRLRFRGDLPHRPMEMLWGDEDPSTTPVETELFRGRLLLPFADRIKGGRYTWDGTEYQLPINDREMGDAIHGFLYRTALAETDHTDGDTEASLTLETTIPTQDGYPWPLRLRLRYILRDREFVVRMRVVNRGETDAPLSVGWHPYFFVPGTAPGAPVDSAVLHIPADRYFEMDSDLRLTGAQNKVSGTLYDFRTPRAIGTAELDVGLPLRGAERDVVLAGRRHQLHIQPGGAFQAIQLFIPPRRAAIAVEPISAPAEAFNLPDLGVCRLVPGQPLDAWVVLRLAATTEL
ncbi:MAG: hypothetical protein PF508_21145 [Spirochaeta sp.]|jgi:aldose 1-epimerase|nr:hypothetical protein [Spirochaeta sp.]